MIFPTIMLAAALSTQVFQQLPLQVAFVDAVANSPDVRAARERVRENAALLAAARLTISPQAQVSYVQAPQGANGATIMQRLTTIGTGITLGDFFTYSPAVRQARASLQAAQFDLLDAQRTERARVMALYYAALRAIATEQLRLQIAAQAQTDERTAQKRFNAGDAPRLDLIRARVAIAQAQADLESARVSVANADQALSLETGVPVTALQQRVPERAVPNPVLPADPGQAVTLAQKHRADLTAALAAVEAERSAVSIAERSVLPAITVNAGYTRGVDSGVNVHGPSINVTASLPLSNVAKARADAERARLAQAQAKVDILRRKITLEVASAARAYGASATVTQAAAQAREAAQEELNATEIGYRNGASSSLDVSDARRTYVQAAISELNALYAQAQARATLEDAIGL